MPNKPDKFGIKFWVLVEVESKYMVNLRPYLGAQEKESRQGVPLAQDVVLRLVSPVKSKEYNNTTDNFFTSVALAEKLEAIATTVVGTVRANSKSITKIISRKNFILQLIEKLRAQYVRRNTEESTANNRKLQQSHGPKKRRKCTKTECTNATVTICRACESPTCGKCATENSREISVICKQ